MYFHMRAHTQMSERPPVYSVINDSGTAHVRFYTDVKEQQRDEDYVFTATMWEMSCPWCENLERRVNANQTTWLAKIKALTMQEETEARLDELAKTATDDAIAELAMIVATLMDAVGELAALIQ